MNKLICAILIMLTLALPAMAKNALDLSVAGTGARPMGIGRAYTAVADDANAIFSNPAGLGLQKSWGLTSMTSKLLGRVEYKMLGGVLPTQIGTFGIGYLTAATPAGYLTTDKASLASAVPVSYGSSILTLSYGRDLNDAIKMSNSIGKLSVGANYKTITNQFEGTDASGSGSSLDLGIIFQPTPRLTTGLTFKNASGSITWKNGTEEKLPRTINVGGALNLEKLMVAADLERVSGTTLVHGGIELRPFDSLVLRFGGDQSATSQTETALNLTGGVGIKLDGFSFDYAYRQDSSLAENSTHYFSISFQPAGGKLLQTVVKSEKERALSEMGQVRAEKTDGVYRLVKKAPSRNILSYYE